MDGTGGGSCESLLALCDRLALSLLKRVVPQGPKGRLAVTHVTFKCDRNAGPTC